MSEKVRDFFNEIDSPIRHKYRLGTSSNNETDFKELLKIDPDRAFTFIKVVSNYYIELYSKVQAESWRNSPVYKRKNKSKYIPKNTFGFTPFSGNK